MQKLVNVQYLRAIAALLVVLSHTLKELKNMEGLGFTDSLNLTLSGQFGVDIFFVISGFIMFYVTRNHKGTLKESWVFLQKRVVRIVPLYWVLTLVTILISVLLSQYKNNNDIDVYYVVASFLFIPAERALDGNVTPVLGLGWTLNYEMFFYLIFAAGMLMPKKRFLPTVVLSFITIVVIGVFIDKSFTSVWYWTRPIIIEFVLGILVAYLYLSKFRLSNFVGGIVLAIGVATWLISSSMIEASRPEFRLWFWGIPAALIVASVMLTEKTVFSLLPQSVLNIVARIGDASFSLYLGHMFVIRALSIFLVPAVIGSSFPIFYLLIAILGAFVFAEFTYRFIELPSNRYGLAFLGLNKPENKHETPASTIKLDQKPPAI
ncbi:MAG: acyltransferase [Colwellia sp.]|jgi:Predicted acyltransferases